MNYTSKVIQHPAAYADGVHVYGSQFMTKRMGIPPTHPNEPTQHKYHEVRRWVNRIQQGKRYVPPARRMKRLRMLYVIINEHNAHWLYLKVMPHEKKIQLVTGEGLSRC